MGNWAKSISPHIPSTKGVADSLCPPTSQLRLQSPISASNATIPWDVPHAWTALFPRRFVADGVLYWCLHYHKGNTNTMTGAQHA